MRVLAVLQPPTNTQHTGADAWRLLPTERSEGLLPHAPRTFQTSRKMRQNGLWQRDWPLHHGNTSSSKDTNLRSASFTTPTACAAPVLLFSRATAASALHAPISLHHSAEAPVPSPLGHDCHMLPPFARAVVAAFHPLSVCRHQKYKNERLSDVTKNPRRKVRWRATCGTPQKTGRKLWMPEANQTC